MKQPKDKAVTARQYDPEPTPISKSGFTGLAKSVIAFENQGFRNFKIVTLTIKDGEVTDSAYSDAYASFECIAKLEVEMEMSTISLNNAWENGKSWFKK